MVLAFTMRRLCRCLPEAPSGDVFYSKCPGRLVCAGAPVRELGDGEVTTTVALVKTREPGWPLLFVSDSFADATGAHLCCIRSLADRPAADHSCAADCSSHSRPGSSRAHTCS